MRDGDLDLQQGLVADWLSAAERLASVYLHWMLCVVFCGFLQG